MLIIKQLKNMKKIIYITMVAVLLIGGCTKSDVEITTSSNEMRFAAKYPSTTRATGSSFETGDAIGVFVTQYEGENALPLQISGNYANNSKSIFDGTNWSNSPAIYWAEGKFDVYGYHPFDKPTSVDEYLFTVALDQSTEATEVALSGYEASDFLWAKADRVSQMGTVPLTFNHKMSKLVVNLIKGEDYTGDVPTDAVLRVHNTVPSANIDLSSGMVVMNGHASPQSITTKKVEDGVYTAIIVPQRLNTRRPFIEVLSKGVSYLVESSFVFRSGMQHTINITLNNNPDKVKIEIGGEIEGWN